MALSLLQKLGKPEYVFRPQQLLLRALRARDPGPGRFETIRLPWGLKLKLRVGEDVGRAVWRLGVYDLVVSEALWRLTDRDDIAADIGANAGYMTSLLAARAKKVISFEPHPVIFKQLQENAGLWKRARRQLAEIQLVEAAASEISGTGSLCIPSGFDKNAGIAFLTEAKPGAQAAQTIPVRLVCVDDELAGVSERLVFKIDTEGNEALVLKGATRLLRSKRVRDIVFEDHGIYPTPAMQVLESHGYALFRLKKTLMGPMLVDPREKITGRLWEPTNYLATCEPARARVRLRARGWRALRG